MLYNFLIIDYIMFIQVSVLFICMKGAVIAFADGMKKFVRSQAARMEAVDLFAKGKRFQMKRAVLQI